MARYAFLLLLLTAAPACAQEGEGPWGAPWEEPHTLDEAYQTPLAGKPLRTTVFGIPVDIRERDRGDTLALSLGATGFTPNVGGNTVVPFAALYYNRILPERRIRIIFSGVVNNPIDYAERLFGGRIEALAHFENHTIPVATTEIVDGDSVEYSAVRWGWTTLWLGGGLVQRVWPWNIDNEVRVQLFYQASYYYFQSVDETGQIDNVPVANVNIPPDTYVHGVRARASVDMIQRNLMELPHYGMAFGGEFAFLRRDKWEDLGGGFGGPIQFAEKDTRDFLQFTAYAVLALPIPGLSQRHRLILKANVGWMPDEDVDRYNGFRIGGGPPTTESADLGRSPYPAAMFDQFVSSRYAIGSIEYRFEVAFFFFVHFRLTAAWGRVPTFSGVPNAPLAPVRFTKGNGEAVSAGFTSGFLWDSRIFVEYTYDNQVVRGGEDGHNVLFMWSKSF